MKEDCRIIDPCITSQASSTRRIAHKKVSTDKESHTRSHEFVIVILNATKIPGTLRRQQNIHETSYNHRSSLPQILLNSTSNIQIGIFSDYLGVLFRKVICVLLLVGLDTASQRNPSFRSNGCASSE